MQDAQNAVPILTTTDILQSKAQTMRSSERSAANPAHCSVPEQSGEPGRAADIIARTDLRFRFDVTP